MRDNESYHASAKPLENTPPPVSIIPTQADTDQQLLALWLHNRSPHTQRAYGKDVSAFLAYVNKSLREITLMYLQAYYDCLAEQQLSPSSIKRILCSIKSLFSFKSSYKTTP